jgi:hypothetical protein
MTKEYKRLTVRRLEILDAACDIAKEVHYRSIKREELAKVGGTAEGNISKIMGGMENFKVMIVKYAIKKEKVEVIAQAIMERNPQVEGFSKAKKIRYLLSAIGY